MSATPQTIWRVPAFLPYLQPPLTDAVIDAAERKLGRKLPSEYLDLLRVQNGGYIRHTLPESPHSILAGIGPHFPNLTDFTWEHDRDCVSFELDGLVPLNGDGHWHLCLDYRENSAQPKVTYVDVECDHQEPVADSFAGYLSLLEIDAQETEFVLLNTPDLERIKAILSTALNAVFDPPSSNAHGYLVHLGRIAGGPTPEWIWLSPNFAPRGFVRPEDERYEELRHLLPGEAPRYPLLPESCFLLNVTDGLRPRVIEACKRHSLDLRPLGEYTA